MIRIEEKVSGTSHGMEQAHEYLKEIKEELERLRPSGSGFVLNPLLHTPEMDHGDYDTGGDGILAYFHHKIPYSGRTITEQEVWEVVHDFLQAAKTYASVGGLASSQSPKMKFS